MDTFISALTRELALRVPERQSEDVHTLYFGGGTPSRLGPDGVARAVNAVRERFALSDDAEVTLEANPEDITVDAVRAWRAAGINRLSIGMQSFNDQVLTWMHRVHDAEMARRAVSSAREGGITDLSLDLIFALPTSLNRDWSSDLDSAIALNVDHISLYGLTIEPQTPLGRWQARGDVEESPEESYEAEFLLAHERLSASGYAHYEVSNFAREGHRARHNSAYWHHLPYLGVGPSAHGYDGVSRRWNLAAYPAWESALVGHADPISGSEELTHENRIAEAVYLGLRTSDGLELSRDEAERLKAWFTAGWLEWIESGDVGRARCTPNGWLRLDRLAADLTSLRSRS